MEQRAVVVTGDHGYVLEAGGKLSSGQEYGRWRPVGHLAAEELVFEGLGCNQVTGLERIIVPWSEAVRYSQKKQGYHGGATFPRITPATLAMLVPQHRTLAGWESSARPCAGVVESESCHGQVHYQCQHGRHDVPSRQQPYKDAAAPTQGRNPQRSHV